MTLLLLLGMLGHDAPRQMANPARAQPPSAERDTDRPLPGPLSLLVDELAQAGRGIILTMGKSGVGKTTLAAAIAVALARRAHAVHLSTTNPARPGRGAGLGDSSANAPGGERRMSRAVYLPGTA